MGAPSAVPPLTTEEAHRQWAEPGRPGAPGSPNSAAGPGGPASRSGRRRLGRLSPGLTIAAASLALAALSLLIIPGGLGYDPYSWLVWGREIDHLRLSTSGAASSVKPLPILVDALLGFTGSAAPTAWLVVARAGAIAAVILAFRLGSRLSGRWAGAIAAAGLFTSYQYLGYLMIAGMSEPLGAVFVLAAAEAHLDRRPRKATVLLFVAGLVRAEIWPFLVLYALVYVVRPSPRRTAALWVLAALAVLLPLAWFLPDVVGSGRILRSAARATQQSQGGPILQRFPGLATLKEAAGLLLAPLTVGYVVGLGQGALAWRRGRRWTPTLGLALAALAWLATEMAMAQLRLDTGAPRYLLLGLAPAAVVAGCAWVEFARMLERRLVKWAGAATAAALVASWAALMPGWAQQASLAFIANRQIETAARRLPAAVQEAGGSRHVIGCGPISTAALEVTALVWTLHARLGQVSMYPASTGTVFVLGNQPTIPADLRPGYRPVTQPGGSRPTWLPLTTCPPNANPTGQHR